VARGSQTFQKRQRENKLREKAQQKRERRQQRHIEKKQARALESSETSEGASLVAVELAAEEGNLDTGDEADDQHDTAEAAEPYSETRGWRSNQADPQGAPQNGGVMASKLFVGNLPRGVTDSSLAEFVTSAGFQVASAVVIRDRMTGNPKGFGFVELAEGEDLQKAIRGLDGQMLEANRVNVNEARPQRTGFSGPRGGGGGGGRGRRDFGGGRGRW
jgi:cold-inducible RNA-binding protein